MEQFEDWSVFSGITVKTLEEMYSKNEDFDVWEWLSAYYNRVMERRLQNDDYDTWRQRYVNMQAARGGRRVLSAAR